jgi:hypothetical protein
MHATPKLEPFHGRHWSLLLLSLLTVSAAFAGDEAEVAPSPFKLSGFATLGLTHNDNSEAGVIFSSAQTQPVKQGLSGNLDSVVGLQVDWQLLPATSMVLQGVARAGEDFQPKVRMGYMRQQFGNDTAVRLGRMRSPLFYDSDVAEIGYAYLMARAPIPMYVTPNNVTHLDGADVQWRHSVGNTAFLLQGYYGSNSYKHRLYNTSPVQETDVELHDIAGLAVSATLPNLTLRASHTTTSGYTMRSPQISQLNAGLVQVSAALSGVAANPMLPAAMTQALTAQAQKISAYANPYDSKPTYTSIGFDSNIDAWRLMGEWALLDTQSALTGKYEGYHLSVGYSIGALTPYVSVSRQRRTSPALDTSALAATGMNPQLDGAIAQLKAALDQSAQFVDISMNSASVGVRWDVRENMAIKVQYDRLETPNSTSPGYLTVTSLPFNNKVNLFTVALDIAF